MIARLLYAAVALCLLGAWPEHPVTRSAPSVEAAAPAATPPAAAAAGDIVPRPPDFAIPRIQR